MTSDGNPKPVQFIQPNVLDRARLSVGKHDAFSDQFALLRTVLLKNFCRPVLPRGHCLAMFGRAVYAVQSGSTAKFVPAKDRWRLLFEFAEPVDLRSKALRGFRLFLQERA